MPEHLRSVAADAGFSGVVRRQQRGVVVDEFAAGFANRALGIRNQTDTRFATASATKGLTALTVLSLVEEGQLALSTPARTILGERLRNVDDAVTIAHLLSHRSGIGDYLDEDTLGDIDDHIMGVPVHTLERPSDYLDLLACHPQVSNPGERFAYNNSGYVILSVLVELLTGSFHEAVNERVLQPAGMDDGGFLRSDDLPPNTATGYLENGRTNVHHLPVIGAGDGGVYLTLDDVSSLWAALFGGKIVAEAMVVRMATPLSETADGRQYGLGFWLGDDGDQIILEGMDAGVSFRSVFDRRSGESYIVISNTSSGVWPIARAIEQSTP